MWVTDLAEFRKMLIPHFSVNDRWRSGESAQFHLSQGPITDEALEMGFEAEKFLQAKARDHAPLEFGPGTPWAVDEFGYIDFFYVSGLVSIVFCFNPRASCLKDREVNPLVLNIIQPFSTLMKTMGYCLAGREIEYKYGYGVLNFSRCLEWRVALLFCLKDHLALSFAITDNHFKRTARRRLKLETTERWLSVEEIADHLGVASITVYRWLEKEKIPAHRVGKLWKFKPTEVDDWVKFGGATPITPHGAVRRPEAKRPTIK